MRGEYVIYSGKVYRPDDLHFASWVEWDKYARQFTPAYENEANGLKLVARGLTRAQAVKFVEMSKED